MKIFKVFVVVLVLLVLSFLSLQSFANRSEQEILDWSKKYDKEILNKHMHLTTYGSPFYYLNRGGLIYDVEMKSLKTSKISKIWFRFDFYSTSVIAEKI